MDPARRMPSADCVARTGGWELCARCLSNVSDAEDGARTGARHGGKLASIAAPAGSARAASPFGVCCLDAAKAPRGSEPKGTGCDERRLSDLEPGRDDDCEGGREDGRLPGRDGGREDGGATSTVALFFVPRAAG